MLSFRSCDDNIRSRRDIDRRHFRLCNRHASHMHINMTSLYSRQWEDVRIVVMVSIAFIVVVRIVGALECKGNPNSWTHYGVDSHLPSFYGLQRAIRGKFRRGNNPESSVAW